MGVVRGSFFGWGSDVTLVLLEGFSSLAPPHKRGFLFAARGSGVAYAPSFDFKMIRAPCLISKCSFGHTNSAFSKAALQIRKLLDRATTSSWGPCSFTILKESSSDRY